MKINNYNPSDSNIWKGRIDDPSDPDSFRMHQIVQRIDLSKEKVVEIDPSKLNVGMLGFCCDEGIFRNLGRVGAAMGPEYIRKQFSNLPVVFGNKAKIYDAGDVTCIQHEMEEAQENLSLAVEKILELKMLPMVLGGGHEMAFGHYNGILKYLQKQSSKPSIGIINFDAHLDMRPYSNGSSSGTMFAQIADNCIAEQIDFAYLCFGAQLSGNTISLFKKADHLNAEYILAKNIIESNYENINKRLNAFIDQHEHIYVTICSDLFNAAFAPGVSALSPFGMNPEVVLKFIKKVLQSNKVISLDIAEVSPRFDSDNRTAKLAAVILFAAINTLVGIE